VEELKDRGNIVLEFHILPVSYLTINVTHAETAFNKDTSLLGLWVPQSTQITLQAYLVLIVPVIPKSVKHLKNRGTR
jgi:hypothetical protein